MRSQCSEQIALVRLYIQLRWQRYHISLVIVEKIQERYALSGGNAEATKPRSAHEKLVHSVPYTEGAPGDIYIRGFTSALHAAFFLLLCWALCMAHLFVPYGN